MQKVVYALLAFCLIQGAFNQTTCDAGKFLTTPAPAVAGKATCTACFPLCKTCSNTNSCDTFVDKIVGYTAPNTPFCIGSVIGAEIGYNKNKDACSRCMEGCAFCAIDYNVCVSCSSGWDFDRSNTQCLRATLGLAGIIFVLAALTLIMGLMTCICACKL